MKNLSLYLLPALLFLAACKENKATGEMEPSWLFWVFLGLIAFGLIAGVFTARRKTSEKDSVELDKTEQQIQKFEDTLERKAEKENEASDQKENSENKE